MGEEQIPEAVAAQQLDPATTAREHDYQHQLTLLTLSRLKVTALLIVAMVSVNAIAQFFLDPLLFDQLLPVRSISILLCLTIWLFCHSARAFGTTFGIGLVLICIVSVDLETAIIYTSGYNSPFQTGLALLIVGAGLLVPFTPRQIMVISTLVWAVFLAPLLVGGQHISAHEPGFTASALFMMCATLITIASSYMTSSLRHREFFARRALYDEKARSERLLLNILPAPIARRLKQGEQSISDGFDDISVLFADLVGFTDMADKMSADELVSLLNRLFSTFDTLVEQHGLEKVKTIGDAYMVVGGAPEAIPDHAARMAALALDMLDAMHAFNVATGRSLQIRIGVHRGPAVAGVIGLNKFTYDLWGDTVNTASRMESCGLPGRIQASELFASGLMDAFTFEERGHIDMKGKGSLRTWLLTGRQTGV